MSNKSASSFKSSSQVPKYLQNSILSKSSTTEYDLLNRFTARAQESAKDDAPDRTSVLKNGEALAAVEEQEVVCQRGAKIKDLDPKKDDEELLQTGSAAEIAKRMEEIRRGPRTMAKGGVVKKTPHGLRKVNQSTG